MMQTYLPGNSGKMLMVMHMQHHRFANQELDPDHGVAYAFKNASFLWFIPSRGMVWLVCFVFMYLPHVPHVYTHRENPCQATLMLEGWNKVMSVLMMYQNYHLAHHLYPTVLFYRYKKAWDARKAFHEAHHPAKVNPLLCILIICK